MSRNALSYKKLSIPRVEYVFHGDCDIKTVVDPEIIQEKGNRNVSNTEFSLV